MRSREDVKNDVVQSLYSDTRVDAGEVTVEVDDGVVVLGGSVPTYRARSAAEQDARVIRDVTHVDNAIAVRYPATETARTDAAILDDIREALDLDPDIDASDVTVNVRDGWVVLRGSVARLWQKGLVDDLVATAPGVLGFDNELAVVPTQAIDDRVIADAIVEELERRAAVDPIDLDVTVLDGHVTLRGTVPHWRARDAAHEAARLTAGVTGVTDELVLA